MTGCPALAGGEFWYRDAEVLNAELQIHGSQVAAGKAHGGSEAAVAKWARRHGLKSPGHRVTVGASAPGDDVSEVEMLRQRIRELERHATKVREGEVMEERVTLRLLDAIQAAAPTYKPTKKSRSQRKEQTELFLLFSDTHASEVVSLEETLGLNAYDWPIMLGRMRRMQEAVLSHAEHFDGPISRLHVAMLGDMLSGDIHDELAITNDRPTAEAVVDFAYDTAEWLQGFAQAHSWEISVYGVPGNHPRAKPKPAAKQAHNNADWLSYKMLEARLRDDSRFSFNIGRGGFNTVEICGYRGLLMHGDGIRSTMPGVPWGGVVRRVTTLEQQFSRAGQPLDFVAMGHFHAANALSGVGTQTFLNGSVKGPDEYSLKQFGHGHSPSQRLLAFHPARGVTAMFWLDLDPLIRAQV